MAIALRQAVGFIAGFWLALHLLLPLVDGRSQREAIASPDTPASLSDESFGP